MSVRGPKSRQLRNNIIHILSTSGATSLYRKMTLRRGPLVRILAFHDVPDRAWFASLLDACLERYQVLTPEDFITKRFVGDQINILFTFDDGYRSWSEHVLPELEARGRKGLFFVSSGLIEAVEAGTAAEFMRVKLERTPKEPLTKAGLITLASAGHTIGGHTVGHVNLTTLAVDELKTEIMTDKAWLEATINQTLTEFAYPFGTDSSVNEAVKDAVQEAGYNRAYLATPGFVPDGTDPLLIPRLCIENNLPPGVVTEWIEGGYDIMRFLSFRQ